MKKETEQIKILRNAQNEVKELVIKVAQSCVKDVVNEELLKPDDQRLFLTIITAEKEISEILDDVMNLGMTLRQNQLNGVSGKSGKEVLKDYIKNLNNL